MSNKDLIAQKESIKDFFIQNKQQLLNALPQVGITPDRMIRLVFSAISQIPKLAECTPESLFNAMIQTATLGLEPCNGLGHAYLIPFKDNKTNTTKVQLIIGYKGYLALCRRSGELSSISSHIVCKDDMFKFQYGTEEFIKHIPNLEIEYQNDDIIYAYAVAKLKDGGCAFEIMSRSQIDGIRARSKSKDFGPWVTDFDQMARKTVIRRLMNYLPMSIQLANAVQFDAQNEAGIQDISGIATTIETKQPAKDKPSGTLSKMAEMAKKDMKVNVKLLAHQEKVADAAKFVDIDKIIKDLPFDDAVKEAIRQQNWQILNKKECDLICLKASKEMDSKL